MIQTVPTVALDRVAPEAVPGIRLLPIVHERVDLASLVRAVLDRLDPAAVAVELPTTLAEVTMRAIRRLPRISVIVSEEPGEDALVWVAAPGDPLVEAMRWAVDAGRPVIHVDPDLPYTSRHHDPIPDPHVMWEIGVEADLDMLDEMARRALKHPGDLLREKGTAHHIARAAREINGPMLCLLGAAHIPAVSELLRGPTAPPLARQHRSHVELGHLHPDSLTTLLHDPPLAHAVFELLRSSGRPAHAVFADTVARRMELAVAGLRLVSSHSPEDPKARLEAAVRYAARHASREAPGGRHRPDRGLLGEAVWQMAAASYLEQTRDELAPWQHQLFTDFARRHSRIQGSFVAGLYEWVVAARGVADDNLAWEVFQLARAYPWQEDQAELATVRIDGDMLDLGTRKVRFRRRFFRVKHRPILVPVKARPETKDPAEWLQGFQGSGICSHPPEDVVVEDYGRFLQSKAISKVAAETARSEPFTTSMLDGVDLRETMRNWHESRIYVRELGRAHGDAGAVVVIFEDPADEGRYPYRMSWLGEHDQESDMAFYATDPTQHIVGPGIMRASYGGFMLSYPPGRLFDVWRDPDYGFARRRSEVLIMAAVDYSTKKLVVHVAARPPSGLMKEYASLRGKRLVHIPLGSLSPLSLKKIRVVHILAGKETRNIAPDYIW